MTEKSKESSDHKHLASVEIPGKGRFFLHNALYKDRDGFNGALWVIGPEATQELSTGGVDAVLANPDTKESAALFMIVQELVGEHPGLGFDFYNNPHFTEDYSEGDGRASGIVNTLGEAGPRDPLSASVRETLRTILTARAYSIKQDPDKTEMRLVHTFFGNTKDPLKVIQNIYSEYQYTVINSVTNPFGNQTISLLLPLAQLIG
jgi:hypothetical protein